MRTGCDRTASIRQGNIAGHACRDQRKSHALHAERTQQKLSDGSFLGDKRHSLAHIGSDQIVSLWRQSDYPFHVFVTMESTLY